MKLTVKQFNQQIKVFPLEDQKALKRRKRLLKSRVYAQRCRDKKKSTSQELQKLLLEKQQQQRREQPKQHLQQQEEQQLLQQQQDQQQTEELKLFLDNLLL